MALVLPFVVLLAAWSVPPAPGAQEISAETEKFPSLPEFTCEPGMELCNEASESEIADVLRYGRGAAWVDVDGDGWDDLFLADCDNRWGSARYGVSMFFLNLGDGTFRPVPATELGIAEADLVSTWNGSFADYDNDGDPDLLLANGGYSGVSNVALYENRIPEGEGFESVTEAAGLGLANSAPANWWGSSWADYDSDGWLDFVVTRTDGPALLFRNTGEGAFEEVGSRLGVGVEMEDGKNPVWIDHDADGDLDLYLAGMWQHAFYRNDGSTFEEITGQVFSRTMPLPQPWIGPPAPIVFAAAAEDFNQDGFDDLYLGRFDLQDMLLLNDGSGAFSFHSTDWGMTFTNSAYSDFSRPFENTMGLGVGDLFDDGYPDVYIGTGNPVRAAPDIVLCNTGGEGFERCTERVLTGADREWTTRGHGTVFSDFDHDGDTDMMVNLGGHPGFDAEQGDWISRERAALFVNQEGPSVRTAVVTLEGTESNRDAIGARLKVEGDSTRFYTVRSMQGFQSQNSRSLVLSLGEAESADVEIRWPSGRSHRVEVRAGERRAIREPAE